MEGKIAKPILFSFLFLVLCMPLLQHITQVIDSGKLGGAVRNAPDTSITLKGWWEGGYQEAKTNYINDNMGFRPDFVRLNNQIDYMLFRKLHANGVVLGKNQYLYENGYVDAYCGIHYIGDYAVRLQMYKLKKVQDTLDKLGKSLVVVFAPSKARFFPEFLPPGSCEKSPEHSIYNSSLRFADSFSVRHIDFDGWFVQMKDTSRYHLFNKLGIHWSKYGSLLASDSLLSYLQKLRNIRLPRIVINKVELKEDPLEGENDISLGLNLAVPWAAEMYAHPDYYYTEDSTYDELKTIFIGDSFNWSMIYNDVPRHLSKKNWEMWYYFNEVWSERKDLDYIGHYDWMGVMLRSDCIIILNTEVNMHSLGSGFVDRAYEKFYGEYKP